MGTLGNLLLLLTICLYKKLRTHNNVFVVNLAITDVIVCTILIPALIVSSHTDLLRSLENMCHVIASLMLFHCGASTQYVMWIAVQRYIHVCGSHSWLRRMMLGKRILGVVLITWGYCLLLATQGWTGWTRYTIDPDTQICTLDIEASLSYNIVITILSVILPFSVILLCYFLIIRKVDRSRCRLKTTSTQRLKVESLVNQSAERQAKSNLCAEVKLILTLSCIIVTFLACWTPALVCLLFHDYIPRNINTFTAYSVLFHSCVNPVLYGVMNGNFRKYYKLFFSGLTSCGPCKHDEYQFETVKQQEASTMACISQIIGTSSNRNVIASNSSATEISNTSGNDSRVIPTPVVDLLVHKIKHFY